MHRRLVAAIGTSRSHCRDHPWHPPNAAPFQVFCCVTLITFDDLNPAYVPSIQDVTSDVEL